MKISGFTMVRNATKLFYPIKASIESILPLVDEFVVALGNCDEDDTTEQEILSIQSDKIKIIHTVWDLQKYPQGMEYAHQTDIAKEHCTGDWLFYIQSDEVVHEKYLPAIKQRCAELLSDLSVDGLLFHYRHFWGDFDHYVVSHAWYPKEIRIIRNDKTIHSWRDAQSFRRIPNFDGLNYNAKEGTTKLQVALVDAYIYHYGFVRPPRLMQKKNKNHNTCYRGEQATALRFKNASDIFDYGDLSKLNRREEPSPIVLKDWIGKFDWADQLYPAYKPANRKALKHEKLKYRILTFLEQNFLKGNLIGGFKNYRLVKR
ncbi:MAG TPA: glycosyltransferase family 2 protein [Cyclobacteriaceae bacterium]